MKKQPVDDYTLATIYEMLFVEQMTPEQIMLSQRTREKVGKSYIEDIQDLSIITEFNKTYTKENIAREAERIVKKFWEPGIKKSYIRKMTPYDVIATRKILCGAVFPELFKKYIPESYNKLPEETRKLIKLYANRYRGSNLKSRDIGRILSNDHGTLFRGKYGLDRLKTRLYLDYVRYGIDKKYYTY